MARSNLTQLQVRIPMKSQYRDLIFNKLKDHDSALDAVMGDGIASPEETVTVGVIAPTKPLTLLSVDGTKAYSLADGTYKGQRKIIRCTVASNTPAGTITPAHLADGTTLFFNAVEDMVELVWNGTAWRVVMNQSVTIA
jgi:hypothetical protein